MISSAKLVSTIGLGRAARRISSNATAAFSALDISEEVKCAIDARKPIVALESTIITHGMPYPSNVETAIEVEQIVREEGAIPATIAILNGRIKVGLGSNDLNSLGNNRSVIKVSRRDLGYVLSTRQSGGTTVAGTMIIAHLVGIPIFATGGIGGVHREGDSTMDVSADLVELGRTNVAVFSSGVKAILDIPKTLEYLETQGVFVGTFQGDNNEFPAFYTRRSGESAPYSFTKASEIANLIKTSLDLNLNSGMLIGIPIPKESEIDPNEIDTAISQALIESKAKGIKGKAVTPFLLQRVLDITRGKSLEANIALIKNNARVAAQVAVKLAELQPPRRSDNTSGFPTVIGGASVDSSFKIVDKAHLELNGATYASLLRNSAGGVGRNVAEALIKLHGSCNFISAVGDDQNGKLILNSMGKELRNRQFITVCKEHATAIFLVIFDQLGDCKLIVGATDVFKTISPDLILKHKNVITKSPLVVFDANLSLETMETVLKICKEANVPAFFEPTDLLLATKPFELPRELSQQIKFISPNLPEIIKIINYFDKSANLEKSNDLKEILTQVKQYSGFLLQNIDTILVTLGSNGIVSLSNRPASSKYFDSDMKYLTENRSIFNGRLYPAKRILDIVNVSGAGDSFTSGFISATLRGWSQEKSIAYGMEMSKCALKSNSAVPDSYTEAKMDDPIEYKDLF